MSQAIDSFIKQAKQAYEMQNYKKCHQICETILQSDSHNLAILTLLGNLFFMEGNFLQARKIYQKIEKIDSENIINNLNLANVFFELQDNEKTKFYAQKVLQTQPQNSKALSLLGNAYLNLQEYDDALAILKEAEKCASDDFWIPNLLSQVWQHLGNYGQAFECAYRSVQKSQGAQEQQLNLGYLLYEISLEQGSKKIADYLARWQQDYGTLPQVDYMISALKNSQEPIRAEASYVTNVFDTFAPDFEAVLSELNYQAPQYIAQIIKQKYRWRLWKNLHILDLGCGTGLCGKFIKNYTKHGALIGVDLSSQMLSQAQQKKCYSQLFCEDILTFLQNKKKTYDVVVAADVLTYLGDLSDVFSSIEKILIKNGRVVFTISKNDVNDSSWLLHQSGRFLHHQNYVKNLLIANNMDIEICTEKTLRFEGETPVQGYVICARKKRLKN